MQNRSNVYYQEKKSAKSNNYDNLRSLLENWRKLVKYNVVLFVSRASPFHLTACLILSDFKVACLLPNEL